MSSDPVQDVVVEALYGEINLGHPALLAAVNAADGGVVEVKLHFWRAGPGRTGIRISVLPETVVEPQCRCERFLGGGPEGVPE